MQPLDPNHPVLDPTHPVERIFIDCVQTFRDRSLKYANDGEGGHWALAFVTTATILREQFGMEGFTPADVCKVMIALKQARQQAGDGRDHDDDSQRDSRIDEINYMVLLTALEEMD